jgi:hypothetical protein
MAGGPKANQPVVSPISKPGFVTRFCARPDTLTRAINANNSTRTVVGDADVINENEV